MKISDAVSWSAGMLFGSLINHFVFGWGEERIVAVTVTAITTIWMIYLHGRWVRK